MWFESDYYGVVMVLVVLIIVISYCISQINDQSVDRIKDVYEKE